MIRLKVISYLCRLVYIQIIRSYIKERYTDRSIFRYSTAKKAYSIIMRLYKKKLLFFLNTFLQIGKLHFPRKAFAAPHVASQTFEQIGSLYQQGFIGNKIADIIGFIH